MTSDVVRLPPRLIPAHPRTHCETLFAALFPNYLIWLIERGIDYRLSCYHWPEMLAQMAGAPIGMTVCEIELIINDNRYTEVLETMGW